MWYQTGPLIKHKLALPQYSTMKGIADDVKPSPRRMTELKKIDPLSLEPRTPEEMIKDLQRRFGSVLRAMRSVCDIRDGRMTFREFCISYERLGYSREVRSVWFLLDKNLSGDVSMEQLDPEAFLLLKHFHDVLTQKYGSLWSGWRHCLDFNGRGVVPFPVFLQAMQKELGLSKGEAVLLFKCLDLAMLGSISYDEIVFLEDWAAAERRFAKPRGARWVNRDPTGIVDWDRRHDVLTPAPTREISMVPQVGPPQAQLPSTARNFDPKGIERVRSFSLSPRASQLGLKSRLANVQEKTSRASKERLPDIK